MRTILSVLLAGLALTAHAVPVSFLAADYDTLAFAETGAAVDGPYADGPAAPPLITSADAMDGDNRAAATAIADTLFLAASTEANAIDAPAAADAIASFTGTFMGFGSYALDVIFDNIVLGDPGAASAVLVVTLSADALILLDTVLTLSEVLEFDFVLPDGVLGLLDLTLISTSASDLGSGFNLASVAFDLQRVPEPATSALLLTGLWFTGRIRRQRLDMPTPA
jgi:hypothetical protein